MSDTITFEDRIRSLVVEVLTDLGLVSAPAPASAPSPAPVVDASPAPQQVLGVPPTTGDPTVGV
jgi:hypothetical protein